jgi:hypothetical protein
LLPAAAHCESYSLAIAVSELTVSSPISLLFRHRRKLLRNQGHLQHQWTLVTQYHLEMLSNLLLHTSAISRNFMLEEYT